jgi:hypothetical protein
MKKEKNIKKKAKTKTKTKQKQNKTKTKMKNPAKSHSPQKNPTTNLPTDEQQQIVVLIL